MTYFPAFGHNLYLLFIICSLKMECEKLAQEKTEMQRHYVMVGIIIHYNILLVIIDDTTVHPSVTLSHLSVSTSCIFKLTT